MAIELSPRHPDPRRTGRQTEWMLRAAEESASARERWDTRRASGVRGGDSVGPGGRERGPGAAVGLQADPFYAVGVALPVFFYFYPQV